MISVRISLLLNVKDNFTIDLSDNFLIPSIGWEIQKRSGFCILWLYFIFVFKNKGYFL